MPGDSTAPLDESAFDRKSAVQVDLRDDTLDFPGAENFRIDAVHADGICPAPVGFHFMAAIAQGENAALTEHHVEIEVLSQVLEQLQ